MPYRRFTIETMKSRLEQARLACFIYQHGSTVLALQQALNEDGSALNNFAQHGLSSDQIGLQFGLHLADGQWRFMLGVTHSNQDRGLEIGAGHLKGEQRAFNLLYAFYNCPKGFYSVSMPLMANAAELEDAIAQQLFHIPELAFLHSALKISPAGQPAQWIKAFILQQALGMKVRMQSALL